MAGNVPCNGILPNQFNLPIVNLVVHFKICETHYYYANFSIP